MRDIKPIETYYNGYRFRSRLEARWAVFFDAMGIKYEYEPEGFVGAYGEPYLPDFYLSDFDVYAEVKGSDKQLYEAANKLEGVVDYQSTPISYAGLILLGPIPYKADHIPYFDMIYWNKGVCSTKCLFDMGSFIHGTCYPTKPESNDWNYYGIDARVDCGSPLPPSVSVEAKYQHWEKTTIWMKRPFQFTNDGYSKARQARFEYGETPHTNKKYLDEECRLYDIPF